MSKEQQEKSAENLLKIADLLMECHPLMVSLIMNRLREVIYRPFSQSEIAVAFVVTGIENLPLEAS